ncbi:MAG: hypothetical protein ISP86_03630 [Shewanellaceae bacterium]|nr:hypothetical protein [Shewanellaceae bacterium]
MLIKFINWAASGIVLLMLSGCPNSSDESSSSTASLLDPSSDVAYDTTSIKDVDIGIPTNLLTANRVTEFNFHLELHSNYKDDLDITYNKSDHDFNPYSHKSFVIRSDNMIVTDSENEDHLLVLYVIPLKDMAGKLMVLATLDEKSISFLTISQAHQAFFLDHFSNSYYASMINENSFEDTSTPYSKMYQHWVGKALRSDVENRYGNSYRPMLPLTTVNACYKTRIHIQCTGTDTGSSNEQGQTSNYLQPLAPLGVRNKNWHTFTYTDSLFDNYVLGVALTAEQETAAKNTTIQELKTSTLTDDIGWFGFSAAKRSNIERLHYIRINIDFDLTTTHSSSKMHVMSMKRKTYTSIQLTDSPSSGGEDYLVGSGGYPAVDLEFKIDDGVNTILPFL